MCRPPNHCCHQRRQRCICCRCRCLNALLAIAAIISSILIASPVIAHVPGVAFIFTSALFWHCRDIALARSACPPIKACITRARTAQHAEADLSIVEAVVDAIVRLGDSDAAIGCSCDQVILGVA